MHSDELPAGRIALLAGIIAVTIAVVVGVVLGWLQASGMRLGGERLQLGDRPAIPGPVLQSAPQPELRNYLAQKQRHLQSSAWVDAPHRIARIPIEDAMVLMVQRAASAPQAGP